MTRKYPPSCTKILYSKASGLCSMSTCRKNIVLEADGRHKTKQIGKIAHIRAHSSGGPRADLGYPQDKIDSYDNWILLCGSCHDMIDTQPQNYSVDALLKIKVDHESWINDSLSQAMTEFSFADLEVAAKAISNGEHSITNSDFDVISLEDKIQRNGLTRYSKELITTGLSGSNEVSNFLVKMTQVDSNFPERLKNAFKTKYSELKNTNNSGDLLFIKMFEFAKNGAHTFQLQSATLAILVHLFHLCDVFEK